MNLHAKKMLRMAQIFEEQRNDKILSLAKPATIGFTDS
ncbi:predicted protein [Botrytis cinerea T4]|uniref:Uncharacterized protein n=1 Tax=Botryotinia fuckeliana (strain T4) TaxID=999810 RepID=G2YAP8_BOTF4|nr:predicted protein [Botrytis cinerea T4]